MNIKINYQSNYKHVQSKIIEIFSFLSSSSKNVKKLMNVTMCDNFLCKWGFGLTHDTTCQTISKCLIKNIDCKKKKKKKAN